MSTASPPATRLGSLVAVWPTRRGDLLLACLLAVLAAFASWQGQAAMPPVLIAPDGGSIWFESDANRVYANMLSRGGDHYRTKVHPLFSLLGYPLVRGVQTVLRLQPDIAVRVVVAGVAALNLVLFFAVLRLTGCLRVQALVFSALAAAAASSVFWSVVPESHPFGTASILLALLVVALDERRGVRPLWYVLVSALTLSFTITNWMAGVAATFSGFRWRRALTITAGALALVTVLFGVQKYYFPTAEFFLGHRSEARYVFRPEGGGPGHVLRVLFSHSMVMPLVEERVNEDARRHLSVQSATVTSTGWRGVILVTIWGALLAVGVWGLVLRRTHPRLRLVLVVTILGQVGLYLVYGWETFLYTPNILPLIVMVAAFAVFTPLRLPTMALALVLVVGVGANNLAALERALALARAHATEGHIVREAMRARPLDLWPRGLGHVVLGWPGSFENDKAYHEPGGSFSPAAGSFGVSIWITDDAGELIGTSDTIALNVVHQRLMPVDGSALPAVVTETPHYRAVWLTPRPGRWVLRFVPSPGAVARLVVRSVGPAGGPVTSLAWDGTALAVNNRWRVTMTPPTTTAELGEEMAPDWKARADARAHVTSATGWAFARFGPLPQTGVELAVDDVARADVGAVPAPTRPSLRLRLPETAFVATIEAQLAHLAMARVGEQARPADPLSYPVPSLRHAAYTVVAFARAGKIAEARALAAEVAEQDFLGVFGPEADGPGLTLWALEELASRIRSRDFDVSLWPHVHRKADLILQMRQTRTPLHRPAIGPIVPRYRGHPDLTLVADPAIEGLINGRLDWQRPRLHVTALSYRGLLDAARLAERVAEAQHAERWRATAAALQAAWVRALDSAQSRDNYVFTSGLWPTGVATAAVDAYRRKLEQRHADRRTADGGYQKPVRRTSFEAAEAHQWLLAGRLDRTWSTLQWLWDNQASPGMYTWWEAPMTSTPGRVDPFDRWAKVRGWVDPPHLTPDYGTAAEVLLLMLDMLAHAADTPEPTIVIGAGIPRYWLDRPLEVRGLGTRAGEIDWRWDGKRVDVIVRGTKARVQLGPHFHPDTPVRLTRDER